MSSKFDNGPPQQDQKPVASTKFFRIVPDIFSHSTLSAGPMEGCRTVQFQLGTWRSYVYTCVRTITLKRYTGGWLQRRFGTEFLRDSFLFPLRCRHTGLPHLTVTKFAEPFPPQTRFERNRVGAPLQLLFVPLRFSKTNVNQRQAGIRCWQLDEVRGNWPRRKWIGESTRSSSPQETTKHSPNANSPNA